MAASTSGPYLAWDAAEAERRAYTVKTALSLGGLPATQETLRALDAAFTSGAIFGYERAIKTMEKTYRQ